MSSFPKALSKFSFVGFSRTPLYTTDPPPTAAPAQNCWPVPDLAIPGSFVFGCNRINAKFRDKKMKKM